MAQTRDWHGMKDMSARLLKERTGEDVESWNQRITAKGFNNAQELRVWLTAHDGGSVWFDNVALQELRS